MQRDPSSAIKLYGLKLLDRNVARRLHARRVTKLRQIIVLANDCAKSARVLYFWQAYLPRLLCNI